METKNNKPHFTDKFKSGIPPYPSACTGSELGPKQKFCVPGPTDLPLSTEGVCQ